MFSIFKNGAYTITRGDTQAFYIEMWKPVAPGQERKPEDFIPFVPGDVVTLTVRRSAKEKDVIIIQLVVTEFDEGKALMTFYPEHTNDLPFRTYVMDVQANLVSMGGLPYTILKPRDFIVAEEVTY